MPGSPEPERHPVRPPLMPPFEGALAKAPVEQMTINPLNVSVEALLANHDARLSQLKDLLEEVKTEVKAARAEIEEVKDKAHALGWKVAWALVGIAGEIVFHGTSFFQHKP